MMHFGIDCSMAEYGFVDYNGHKWSDANIDSYNNYSKAILSIIGDSYLCYEARDAIADRRHQFFATIVNKS